MKKNNIKAIFLCVISVIVVISCIILFLKLSDIKIGDHNSKEDEDSILEAPIIANSTTSFLKSGDSGVQEFINLAKEQKIEITDEKFCYNITPNFILENTDYKIFKFATIGDSFLVYEDKIYKLGNSRNGYGVISFALADMNEDNEYELYFSYSWKSSTYRTNVEYFEPSEEKIKSFNNVSFVDQNGILVQEDGILYLCEGKLSEYIDNTNLRLGAGKRLATIEVKDNEIILSPKS